jgi:DNA polymerase III epsilon subunit-like protein
MNLSKFKKFICADTETESLNLHFARPWQVSFIEFDHTKVLAEHDHYIWWNDLKVSDGAAIVTHFDYSKYKDRAEDPKKVLAKFLTFLNNPEYGIVAQNWLNFDTYVVKTWAREIGMKLDDSYLDRLIDTNAIARGLKSNTPIDKENFLFWQYKILNQRLKVKTSVSTMLKEYNIPHDPEKLHDGLYDVHMTKEVFYQLRYSLN